MTTFDVSMNGEQGDDSSSYSFVGVSEQGSSQDLGEDLAEMHESEHAIAQPGVFPDDTLVTLLFLNHFAHKNTRPTLNRSIKRSLKSQRSSTDWKLKSKR